MPKYSLTEIRVVSGRMHHLCYDHRSKFSIGHLPKMKISKDKKQSIYQL